MSKIIKDIYSFYVKRYKKRFLYCFGFYYLLVIIGAIVGIIFSDLSTGAGQSTVNQFSSTVPGLFEAIKEGEVVGVILMIFGINSILGSFLTITVPNILGLGTLTFVVRPFLWGLIYAPINQQAAMLFIFILPTLLLEGTAYVIAFVSSIDLLLAIVKPTELGEKTRLKAMGRAWIYNIKSYVLVMMLLFVGAVVETVTIELMI